MTSRTRSLWAEILVLVVLLSSFAGAVERPVLDPLPLPDLSSMEDASRRRLEALQDRVAAIEGAGRDAALADAYGTLGMYYTAHHLNDAAEVAFVNASRLAPGDFRWAYYLGFVYQMVGKLELERGAFERALELRPDDLPARLRLAELLLALGENEEAGREYRRVLELSPFEAAAHGGLGRAASALGRPEEAVEHFIKALELQPEATLVHYRLALAYRQIGDMDAARAQLALRGNTELGFADPLFSAIEPLKTENVVEVVIGMAADPEEHDNRSVALFAASYLQDLPLAVDQILEAAEALKRSSASLEPGSQQAVRDRLVRARLHLAVAGIRLNQGDLEAARTQVESVLALAPEMVEANSMLGFVFEQSGNLVAAVARYSAVLDVDPDNTNALRSRAAARMGLHQNREAIADLERLCDLGFEGDGARIRLAVAHLRLGEDDAARENYHQALQLNLEPSDEAQVHHHLGLIAARTGSVEDAVREYRTALALDPGLVAARLDLGVALGRLGRYQESAETFRQIVEADPTNVRARLGEVEALASMGRWREARQRLEEGWQAMPESVELLHALARLLASADDPEIRDGARALELARRTLRDGLSPGRVETLAMASAEAGLFEDAVRLQQELIQRLTLEGRIENLPRLEANLARYRAGTTCCARQSTPD